MRRRTYLIQDPHGEYALEFIRRIAISYGLRPVCFYTDPKERFYAERANPLLRTGVEAAYDLAEFESLTAFADHVRQRFDVVAVVPHTEVTVGVAADPASSSTPTGTRATPSGASATRLPRRHSSPRPASACRPAGVSPTSTRSTRRRCPRSSC
jgi:hypothetical protein